jgi:hypothetical protein
VAALPAVATTRTTAGRSGFDPALALQEQIGFVISLFRRNENVPASRLMRP